VAASSSICPSRLMCLCAVFAVALIAPARPRPAVAERVDTAAPRADRTSGPGGEAPALPAGVALDWWTSVRAQIEQEAYAVQPVTNTAPGTFAADNPAQRWQARFTSAGLAMTPVAVSADDRLAADRLAADRAPRPMDSARPAAADWTVGLRLAAYGAGDVLTPVSAVAPRAEGARVEFQYGESPEGAPALTEWYVNEARGLEHGFTLAVAPAGAGPVTLELAVAGELRPILQPDGQAVELRAPDGAARLRYADLVVIDAGGHMLPSHIVVPTGEPARIQLVVDARGAAYPITIDPLLTGAPTTLTGETAGDWFGLSVATAGDVNGDGYADVVVGALFHNNETGRAYVYLGGASGLSTTAATTLTGEATYGDFGSSVATAGDVNRDGYADVVIGAPRYSIDWTGRAYVYLGGASGLSTTAATTLTGGAAGNHFGESVATAGDVNGDGYADVVVGAYGYSSNIGRAYVYLGGASGLSTTAATTPTGTYASNFGASVATAGDVNGDAYADVVVGA